MLSVISTSISISFKGTCTSAQIFEKKNEAVRHIYYQIDQMHK